MRLVGAAAVADGLRRPSQNTPDGGVKPPLPDIKGTHQEPRLKPGLPTQEPKCNTGTWGTPGASTVRQKMDGLAVCGLFWGRFLWGGFVADAADYSLNQVIDPLFFGGIHHAKAKLGFIFGAFAGADRKGAT
jgi:hypothetical protein